MKQHGKIDLPFFYFKKSTLFDIFGSVDSTVNSSHVFRNSNHISYQCLPYDTDGLPGFSVSERDAVTHIWQRVSEDYSPWLVDVTTEQPAALGEPNVAHVLITNSIDANGVPLPGNAAGGLAFIDVFGKSNYA